MNSLWAVFVYEWRRSLTLGRIAWWFVMAAFPITITLLLMKATPLQTELPPESHDTFWAIFLYAAITCVCSTLSVLLTAGPAVASELEQRSWVYLATRPNGIFWLLLGKYLVAVTWGTTAAWAGATGAILLTSAQSPFVIWRAICILSAFSCIAYSALYLMIGTIFTRRVMLTSVLYTGVIEVGLGMIPAIVNRLTVQFRLRSLLVKWVPTDQRMQELPAFDYVFGSGSTLLHCVWLLTLTSLFLVLALVIAHKKEFTTASEGDM